MNIGIEGFEGFTGGDNTALMAGNLLEVNSNLSGAASSTDTRWSYGRSVAGFGNFAYRLTIANRTKVFQGVGVKKTIGPTTTLPIFEAYDGATLQCWLGYDSNNRQINVYRGSGTTNLIAQSVVGATVEWNNWFFIEWCPIIDPTTGSVEVRLMGTQTIINATGLNTRASAVSQITVAALRNTEGNGRLLVDDYYCNDDQGSVNNNFNGDSRVYSLFPDTDNSVQFTRSAGAVNADLVDDLGDINDDTTYNASSTPGHKDSFNIEKVPSDAVVSALEIRLAARKDDAANRTIRSFLERVGNTANGSTRTLASTYTLWTERYENDPTDSSALTAAKVNAMHLGYEMVS